MFEVRDGSRVLRFEGDLLAQSSSRLYNQDRWVEFELYRSKAGSYVLSRIGQTRLYHALDCSVVQRNGLKPCDSALLTDQHYACEDCDPEDDLEQVAIEKPRYFALVSDSPDAILDALYKRDRDGTRYLTHVAQRLIEEAALGDARIERAYRVEFID